MNDIKALVKEVKAHDTSANPGPWDLAWPTCITTGGQHGDTVADGCAEDDAAFIAHYRTAAPILAAEVERLDLENAARGAEVRRLGDDLRHVSTALGEHLRPNQAPASAIARLRGDLEACEKERDAYQRERDDLRLALLAEQGDIRGAPEGWARISGSWWCRPGSPDHHAEMCRANIHPDGEPYHWTLYTPTLTAEGYAPTAREAMQRADKALQEKA